MAVAPSSRPQRSGRAWPTLCWLPCRTADTRVLSGMVGVGAHSLAASLSQQSLWVLVGSCTIALAPSPCGEGSVLPC